mgnify:CR=1 FL=1
MADRDPLLKPDWVAPARTALLLIDGQVDFGAPEGAMARRGADIGPAQAALARAVTLTQAARAAGVAVVFVRLITRPGADTAVTRQARARHEGQPLLCVEGTPGAEFTGPRPRPGERIVTKTLFSAFHGTGLDTALQAAGIDTLVLAGLTTECCVASSAWDAFERDFHVFIAQDACAAYEIGLHQGALRALQLSGAMLAPAADFCIAWK